MAFISVVQASARIGITPSLVANYIRQGRIKATKVGRAWIVDEKDLAKFKRPPRGRPPTKK